jgi:DnaJ-class molecular chaperone
MESSNSSSRDVNLYSLLKVDRTATEEEIHRAYKNLSTTFHPDKLPHTTSAEDREQVQEVFLEFKRASKYFKFLFRASLFW